MAMSAGSSQSTGLIVMSLCISCVWRTVDLPGAGIMPCTVLVKEKLTFEAWDSEQKEFSFEAIIFVNTCEFSLLNPIYTHK